MTRFYRKAKRAGGSEHGSPHSHSFISTCNLICEFLYVLIINPKHLEVHPLGSTQGHNTIFELTLLIGPILFGWGFDLSLNCLFVCSFVFILIIFQVCIDVDLRLDVQKLLPAVEAISKHG